MVAVQKLCLWGGVWMNISLVCLEQKLNLTCSCWYPRLHILHVVATYTKTKRNVCVRSASDGPNLSYCWFTYCLTTPCLGISSCISSFPRSLITSLWCVRAKILHNSAYKIILWPIRSISLMRFYVNFISCYPLYRL